MSGPEATPSPPPPFLPKPLAHRCLCRRLCVHLHRFELSQFYQEVRRVLRPGGTFAAWTYDTGCINGRDSATNAVFQTFYNSFMALFQAITNTVVRTAGRELTQYIFRGIFGSRRR